MSNTDPLSLAERVEAATGPSLALDVAIEAIVATPTGEPRKFLARKFTASIDAAMQLVGEESGMSFAKSVNRAGGWSVALYDEDVMATGASRALALCAAALKARASQ